MVCWRLYIKKHWDIIGPEVTSTILDILNNGIDFADINKTNLVLIPKKKSPSSPLDSRPISLCNVVYNILSKVLVNRLKYVMPSLVSDTQKAFVHDRSIFDNILVAHEVARSMKRKRSGHVGFVGVKLDMSKAYDCIEWVYVTSMLATLGFSNKWVSLIQKCSTSVTFTLMINGKWCDSILPYRGIRHGDPFSPYLFILCTECLVSLVHQAEEMGLIQGFKVGRNIPLISHLLFADESLIFFCAK